MDEKEKEYFYKFKDFVVEQLTKFLSFLLKNCIDEKIAPPLTYYGFLINNEQFQTNIKSKMERIVNEMSKRNEKIKDMNNETIQSIQKVLKDFKFISEEVEIMKKCVDCEEFDVTLLGKLLKFLTNDFTGKEKLKENIEKLTQFRHDIYHRNIRENLETFGNRKSFEDFENLLLETIEIAHVELGINEDLILGNKIKISMFTRTILERPLIPSDIDLDHVESLRHKLISHYVEILKSQPMIFESNYNGKDEKGIDISDYFVHLQISPLKMPERKRLARTTGIQLYDPKLAEENKKKVLSLSKKILELFNDFKRNKKVNSIFCVKGVPGTGKTFIIRNLINDWVKTHIETGNSVVHFTGIDSYDIVLFIQCRNHEVSSLKEYFKVIFPDLFENEVYTYERFILFLNQTPLLILIDGLDEINENSTVLVQEILENFYSRNIIVTSRPVGVYKLDHVKPQSCEILNFDIHGISDKDRLSYIKKYFPEFEETNERNPHDLLTKLNKLPIAVKNLVTVPFNLTMITNLYISDKSSQVNFELPSDLIENVFAMKKLKLIDHIKAKATERNLDEVFLERCKEVMENVISEIESEAFECLLERKFDISKTRSDKLRSHCKKKMKEVEGLEDLLTVNSFLGNFLSYKISATSKSPIFTFPHASFPEFMVSQLFIKRSFAKNDFYVFKMLMNEVESRNAETDYGNWKNTLNMLISSITNPQKKDDPFYQSLEIYENLDHYMRFCLPKFGNRISEMSYIQEILHYSRQKARFPLLRRMDKNMWWFKIDDEAYPMRFFIDVTPHNLWIPRVLHLEYNRDDENLNYMEMVNIFKQKLKHSVPAISLRDKSNQSNEFKPGKHDPLLQFIIDMR